MRKYISIIIFALLLISCRKDFLDTAVSDQSTIIVKQEYVVDLKTTSSFLNGVYLTLSRDFYNGLNTIYPELVADNIKPIDGGSVFSFQYQWSQIVDQTKGIRVNPADQNMNAFWTAGYRVIRDCNFVIEKSTAFKNENISLAKSLTAQALTLRALVHFNLINVFAQPYSFTANASHLGIPYIVVSDHTAEIDGRGTVAECYAKIIDDLNKSLENFEVTGSNPVFINPYAVKGILSRVYLYKKDYENARKYADEVIEQVPLLQSGYPEMLFHKINNLSENEVLFQLLPAANGINGSMYETIFAGNYFSGLQMQFLSTSDMFDLLNENIADARAVWVNQIDNQNIISKFPKDVVAGFPVPERSYYQAVIRSSELYLTSAESNVHLNNESQAIIMLDAVRMRAVVGAQPTSASGNELLELIYKERRKELCFEGQRMFDVLRLGKNIERSDPANSEAATLIYPNDKAIAPLPDLDVTILGLKQNSSY